MQTLRMLLCACSPQFTDGLDHRYSSFTRRSILTFDDCIINLKPCTMITQGGSDICLMLMLRCGGPTALDRGKLQI